MKELVSLATTSLALGCSTLTEVNAAPVVAVPTKGEPSAGGGLAVHGAIAPADERRHTMLGMDVNARMKATSETQHLALGDGLLYARQVGTKGAAILRAGLSIVFERADEKLLVGGGPYAAMMGGVTLDEDLYVVPGWPFVETRRERTLLTFGPIAELDARFSRPSAMAFFGLGVGLAWANEVVETRQVPIESPPRR